MGVSIYFNSHFYINTKINDIDASGKTVEEAKVQMLDKLNSYTLKLKERGGKTEQINMSDIHLKYADDEQFENLKNEQNPLKWLPALLNKAGYKMTAKIIYDKKLLEDQIDKLSLLDSKSIVEPKNASFRYVNNTYEIVDEVKGNKVNKATLLKCVEDAISKNKTSINLESSDCYINPQYTSKSEQVIKAKDTLNKYVSSKITYTFGDNKEIADGSVINTWLSTDNKFNVTIDEAKVKKYVRTLAYTYNTVGKNRSFAATSGKTINVSGGDYGWQIDISKEADNLLTTIKKGQTVTKNPVYLHTAASHGSNDIGNTYVEIDMTKQHLWFYKNGSLVVEGDVVTGNVSLNTATPAGVYRLKFKQKDAILKGQDYNSPVSFWMPFNQGIGIHDATWRSEFGGNIYLTQGSHGCVNAPYSLAQTIFENIDPGTPIVCFYE